jgi:hypothetical protein
MNQKLLSIKKQITALKEAGGSRARIPTHLWQEISECCDSQPLKEVCQFIGINLASTQSKLKRIKTNHTSSLDTSFKLVQLPSSPTPIMELSLGNGTIIRVFSV